MAEYIEREKAIEICQSYYEHCLETHDYCGDSVAYDIRTNIQGLPIVDVVPVVRCKDCVSFAYYKEPLKYKGKVWEGKCTVTGDLINDDNFFCRYGIRKMAQRKEGAE